MVMKLYKFRQNNSGGSFTSPAISVYIQADNANEANDIALGHDIYFNGVEEEYDCDHPDKESASRRSRRVATSWNQGESFRCSLCSRSHNVFGSRRRA